jgi:hypothetical protein
MTRLCFLDAKLRFWVMAIVLEHVGRKVGLYPNPDAFFKMEESGWKAGKMGDVIELVVGLWLVLESGLLGSANVLVDIFLFNGWKNVETLVVVVFGKLDLMAANEGMEVLLISILLLVLVILILLSSVLALAAVVVVKTDAALDVEIVQRRAMAAARQLTLIIVLLFAEAVCNYISGCSFLK